MIYVAIVCMLVVPLLVEWMTQRREERRWRVTPWRDPVWVREELENRDHGD